MTAETRLSYATLGLRGAAQRITIQIGSVDSAITELSSRGDVIVTDVDSSSIETSVSGAVVETNVTGDIA